MALMMCSYVRIINNSLWEDLNKKGLIPSQNQINNTSKKDLLFSQIPKSLHYSIESVLERLEGKLDWNEKLEILDGSKAPVPNSNLASLLINFIIKSSTYEAGHQILFNLLEQKVLKPKYKAQENDNKGNKWVTFESAFKNFQDTKNGKPKVRKTKLFKHKKRGQLQGGGWVFEEPQIQ
jgi:hypothetical protein